MEPTSNNGPKRAPKAPSKQSSDEFLANQISDARLALESALDDLTLDAARAADVRRWVRRYPWAALGTALVAGFTVAHFAISKRRDKAERGTEDEETVEGASEAAAARPEKKLRAHEEAGVGWRSTLISGLFEILRLAVTQVVSASVRQASEAARMHQPGAQSGLQDGQPAADVAPDAGLRSPDGSPEARS